MDITFVTDTESDTEALALLKELGLPFKKNDAVEKEREEQIEKVRREKRREAEAAAKAVAEVSMPGEYDGFHPILGEKAPNLRPPSAIEFEAFSKCKIYDIHVYEGSRLRKLIPGIDTGDLPIGDLSNPTNLAIAGILITLFFSMLQMVRGK
jgi:hypothetical protein